MWKLKVEIVQGVTKKDPSVTNLARFTPVSRQFSKFLHALETVIKMSRDT